MMLILYRLSDGMPVGNSGTNSLLPYGPDFDLEVQNVINVHGGNLSDYGAFRLHDMHNAETVQAILVADSYELVFDDGRPIGVANIVPRPPVEPEPIPDVSGFIESLLGVFGIDRAEELMATYPTFVRSLDGGTRWDIAQNRMDKMLSDDAVTQAEYDQVQTLWDQFNLPRPE